MGRRLAAGTLFVASVWLVVGVVSTSSAAPTDGPAKTTTPAIPAPSTTVIEAVAPPTLWPSTSVSASSTTQSPELSTTTDFPPPSTSLPPPTTAPPATSFDGFTFLRDFYGRLAFDPFAAAEVADRTAPGSTANAFMLHEVVVAIAILGHTTAPLPSYSVVADGPAVAVCRDDGACESFSDFVLVGPALDTFAVDGQPIAQRASAYERPTTVETLTIEASYAVRRPRDEVLSVVALLATEGGGTTFGWDQASYVDATGRQYPVDAVNSQFPARLEDGDFAVSHVSFPGAQHGGQVVVPMTTDLTGVATTIRVPVVTVR
jgi:hypothetical protein